MNGDNMRTFVIGDIHGRYGALKDVLDKAKFDYENDKLICLGDIVDGGDQSKEVVEELLKIKNMIYVIGNHDLWFIEYFEAKEKNPSYEYTPWIWTSQGGDATLRSYADDIPESHKKFFRSGAYYYIYKNMVFVHGGFSYNGSPRFESFETLTWDRKLIYDVKNNGSTAIYEHVFVGHTTTQQFNKEEPITFHNLTMMDCGCGWSGKLAMMDIDTREVFLSSKQKPLNIERIGTKIMAGEFDE